jgi:pre-mRNA-splicing factor ATP-dependent RNA helicase DHX15/PRP43
MGDKKIGILDPKGKELNPLNNKLYSDRYKELSKVWSKFPAYENAKCIIKSMSDNQISLIISGTGSGKTVLIPKYVLHMFDYQGKIAISLPKTVVTESAAEFAAETLDVELGNEVGFKYKNSNPKMTSNNTKLLYATDGTIVSMLKNDPSLKEYNAVIVDEAHERKVQIDLLMYLLRETCRLRPDFKLIIMSATVNEEIFQNYFKDFKFTTINITGKTNYPIESIFINSPIDVTQYLDKGYEIIKQICLQNDKNTTSKATFGDILFFVTSSNEAEEICKRVSKDNLDGFCIEVYSGMNAEKQDMALSIDKYKSVSKKNRKIVIATNVAESSLTIDNIKYVIDSGYELKSYYDPDKRAKILEKGIITVAQAKQRMGRSGRTGPGICYHLYTKSDFETRMKKFPEPSIRTSNIYDECLNLLARPDIQTVDKLNEILKNFIEPPNENYINLAIDMLSELKLIDENSEINELGKIVSDFRDDPCVSLSILVGKVYNCSKEVAAIFALIGAMKDNIGELFILPSNIINISDDNKQKDMNQLNALTNKFKEKQKKLAHLSGDHLSLLKIFTKYRELRHNKNDKKINDWCYEYFIKRSVLEKAYKHYDKFKNRLRQIDQNTIPLVKDDKIASLDLSKRILYCIGYGFDINTAQRKKEDMYYTKYADQIKLGKDNFLMLKNKKYPAEVIYHILFIGLGRKEINIISKK